jgi:UDP-N-acetylglucosamine 2-epimerase (non-hydrolysing)
LKVLLVAGARPNFMKVAPLVHALREAGADASICHTGQHYDENMSRSFFDDLGIPRPDVNLEVGSGTHAAQTATVMQRFEPVVTALAPDVVVVVGDVNSTLACALVAAKLGIPVAHVEAGLRSHDRAMPEEINRVATDSISNLLYCSEMSGVTNLRAEGVAEARIHLVGNVMIDTLLAHRERARATGARERLAPAGDYGVVTLHRPRNVDAADAAEGLTLALERIAERVPLVFPAHPRTRDALQRHGLLGRLTNHPRVRLLDPLRYLEFLALLTDARLVLTDSGGVQEETTVLGVPCLTLRPNTERPATVEQGTNRVVGTDPEKVVAAAEETLARPPEGRVPDLWDGRAAERIAAHLLGGVLDELGRMAWTRIEEST